MQILYILKGRKEFLKYFDEPLEKGYVFTFNTDLINYIRN